MKKLRAFLALPPTWAIAVLLTFLAVLVAFGLPTSAHAQDKLEFSTGADGGSYAKFGSQAADVCRDEVTVHTTLSPGGSEMNVDRIDANDTNLALAQTDFLWWAGQSRDLTNIKVLLPLFKEHLHFVALVTPIRKLGGMTGYFKGAVTVPDLGAMGPGTIMAASGGAKTTALLVAKQAGIGYQMVPEATSKDALEDLKAGKVDVALLVGAAPMDVFKNMTPADKALLRFVAVPEAMLPQFKGYSPAKVSYVGFNNNEAVQTVTVDSALIMQNYSAKQPVAKLVHLFKKCLLEKGPEQAGITGRHPAWRSIQPDATSKWPMWDDPFDKTAATPVAAPVKKK